MKVVLFCGGEGLRLRGTTERPAQADDPDRVPADPVARDALLRPLRPQRLRALPGLPGRRDQGLLPALRRGGVQRLRAHRRAAEVEQLATDIADWRITFADTGARTPHRPAPAARSATTSRARTCSWPTTATCVTDAPLDEIVAAFRDSGKVAGLVAARPAYSFHVVRSDADGRDHATSPTRTTPASGSTAATSCSGARSSTTSRRRGPGRGAVHRGSSPRTSSPRSATTASRCRWTRSRTWRRSRGCEEAGNPPWARLAGAGVQARPDRRPWRRAQSSRRRPASSRPSASMLADVGDALELRALELLEAEADRAVGGVQLLGAAADVPGRAETERPRDVRRSRPGSRACRATRRRRTRPRSRARRRRRSRRPRGSGSSRPSDPTLNACAVDQVARRVEDSRNAREMSSMWTSGRHGVPSLLSMTLPVGHGPRRQVVDDDVEASRGETPYAVALRRKTGLNSVVGQRRDVALGEHLGLAVRRDRAAARRDSSSRSSPRGAVVAARRREQEARDAGVLGQRAPAGPRRGG